MSSDTVTLKKVDYEALLSRLEEPEDLAATARQEFREREIGMDAARADYLDVGLAKRLLKGESPVRVWREHRGLTLRQLAGKTGVPQGYLSEIETGKKPGSLAAAARLARVLCISLDDLAPTPHHKRRGRRRAAG